MPASPCPVFVISLVRSVDRRRHVTRALGEAGVSFEFIDAVDGSALPEDIGALYDDARARSSRGGQPLTRGEIGCALSHVSLWRKMIREDIRVALIMEDDFGLHEKKLAELSASVIPHLTGTDVVLLTNQNKHMGAFCSRAVMAPYRLKYVTMPTAYSGAYLLTKSAAVVLEKTFTPVAFPADAWTEWPGLNGLVRLRGLTPHPVEHTADFVSTIDQVEQRDRSREPVRRYGYVMRKIRMIRFTYFAVPAYYGPLSFLRRLLFRR